MSIKHPIIAITGSSGAGTTSVKRTFDQIFRREGVKAAYIEGDAFHRYDRVEMRDRMASAGKAGDPHFSHFGPQANLLEKLEEVFRAYAATGFARDILSVSDNLTRALEAIPAEMRESEAMKPLVTGLEATGRELDSVFAKHGISRIAAMGLPLDPNQHQAMVEIPTADAEPGTIVAEMQAGYMIKDRLLRPAMVGVAKKPD